MRLELCIAFWAVHLEALSASSVVGQERSGDRKSFFDTLTDLLNQYGGIGDSDIENSDLREHKNDCGSSITDCLNLVTLRGSSSGIESATVRKGFTERVH